MPVTTFPPISFDVSKYGAVAGVDCWAAIQGNILDAIHAGKVSGNPIWSDSPVEIVFPPSYEPWLSSKPFLVDVPDVTFRGTSANPKLCVLQGTGGNSNMIQLGLSRSPNGQSIPSNAWVSATGVLDGSQPAGTYGLRFFGNSWLSFSGTSWDMGPGALDGNGDPLWVNYNWNGLQKFTIDFCFERNGATWPTFAPGGLGDQFTNPSPYCLTYDGTNINLFLATNDGTARRFAFMPFANSSAALLRGSFQIDMTAPSIIGFINRVQVAVNIGSIGSGWVAGLGLAANSGRQVFRIGSLGALMAGNDFAPADVTCFGFKVSSVPLYTNPGAGQPQARIDAQTLNDNLQFLTHESTRPGGNSTPQYTIAHLPLNDSGNIYRMVPYVNNSGNTGYGWFMNNQDSTNAAGHNFTLKDMAAVGTYGLYDNLISNYNALDLLIDNAWMRYGGRIYGSLPAANNTYYLEFRNSTFERAGDCSIFAYSTIYKTQNIKHFYPQKGAIFDINCASEHTWHRIQPNANPQDAYYTYQGAFDYPGVVIANWEIDVEGGSGNPSVCYFDITPPSQGMNLVMRNLSAGSMNTGTSVVILRANSTNPSLCDITGIAVNDGNGEPGCNLVTVMGQNWYGDLRTVPLPNMVTLNNLGASPSKIRVMAFGGGRPEISTEGLRARWALDESSVVAVGGVTIDSSGNASHGANVGTTLSTDVPAASASLIAHSRSFNGTSDRIDLGTPLPIQGLSFPYTICFWIKAANFTQQAFIVNLSNMADGTANVVIGIDGPSSVVSVANNGVLTPSYPTSLFTAGVWQHWCITFTGENAFTLYLNAVAQSATGANDAFSGNGSNHIGSKDTTSKFFAGQLSDLRVLARIPSLREIQAIVSGAG